MPPTDWTTDLRTRLDELLEEYRAHLRAALDGLTEDEARARLVPSKTTVLGLLQHVTYVEAVWFGQAVTGQTLRDLGVASTPDRSFTLAAGATTASVLQAHEARCAVSRAILADLPLDHETTGRGTRTVWALYLQVLRELAQHSGHADILREQLLAQRQPHES